MISRARRVKMVNLEAVSARAAYKRLSATLVGNCHLGSLTTGSPQAAGHLNSSQQIEGWAGVASPFVPRVRVLGTLLAAA